MAGDDADLVRVFSTFELREMDRLASSEYGMPTLLLMEHAGDAVASTVRETASMLDDQKVLFVCGPGSNGGDGYAAARLLLGSGLLVHVVSLASPREGSDAWTNATMARTFGVPVHEFGGPRVRELFTDAAIVVDCLFGTGLSRAPEGDAKTAIEWINEAAGRGAFVYAVDVPSGLDADLGLPLGACVEAHATLSLTGSKLGYAREPAAARYTGLVVPTTIGMPESLLIRYGTTMKATAAAATGASGTNRASNEAGSKKPGSKKPRSKKTRSKKMDGKKSEANTLKTEKSARAKSTKTAASTKKRSAKGTRRKRA